MTKRVKKVGHDDACRDAHCRGACIDAPRGVPALKRYVPAPHVVDGINYNVVDSPRAFMGREPGKAVMATPQAPAAVGRVLALHEEAHAAFTPDIPPDVAARMVAERVTNAKVAALCARPTAADIVNVAEDTRINAKLRVRLGIDAEQWEPVTEHYARLGYSQGMKQVQESVAECRKSRDGLSTLLATLPLRSKPGPDAARTAKKFVGRYFPENISDAERAVLISAVDAQRRLMDDACSFDDTLTAAQHMIECAMALETIWGREEARERAKDGGELAIDDERIVDDAMGRKPGTRDDKDAWGTLTIETPERTLRVPTPRFMSRYRATDSGSVFRYPNRAAIDGAVFSTKRRVPGGSVLVDVSGSMSLSDEQVSAIVAAAPLATVAIYSGSYRTGILRIVAKGGTRMTDDTMRADMGGSNIVDGPALRWLAGQQEPRVWVSDGHVTGIRGHTPAMVVDAFAIAKRGRIVRVPDAEQAVRLFSSPSRLMEYIRNRFRTGDELAR